MVKLPEKPMLLREVHPAPAVFGFLKAMAG
jgi:hypothetical protein